MLVGSLLVHAVMLALLFPWLRTQPTVEQPSPTPGTFDLLFDGGAETASSPHPAPVSTPAPSAGVPDAEPQPTPVPDTTLVPDTTPEALSPPPEGPPQPAEPAQEPVPEPAPAPAPSAPPRVSITIPPPPPVPVPEPLPLPPPPTAAPRPPAAPRPATPRNPFADARDYSFGKQSPPPQRGGLGQAPTSGETRSNFATVRGANVGRDWMSELIAWTHERWHYPEQAIANNEDGTTVAELVVDKYSKVLSIEITGRSGSPWLDMGVQALFRGRTLPPFPPGIVDQPVHIVLNMNYILVRR